MGRGLLSSTEAAAVIGITEGTLRVWRTKKKGPRWARLAGRVWYAPADIDRWKQENTVHGGT